ncbi:MAG: hypothetical protein II456_02590 [Firmicutes bacterium]|nr:hypothetical protein [Bacillota bacterium]
MTIREMIDRYAIIEGTGDKRGKIYVGRASLADREGTFDEIRARKGEILKYFEDQARDAELRAAKVRSIEGLDIITAAIADMNGWRREFNASFDSEDGGGFGVRPHPDHDIDALMQRYPRAAAYLKAKEYADKESLSLSEIGKRAVDRILDGDYVNAISDMQSEIKAFVDRHLWD